GCDAPRLPSCDVRRRLDTRWYVMEGKAASGPLSGRPPTGKILVPTRACTSGDASRRWRTRISTSSAMASPPLLLALGLRGRLEHSLSEHVPSVLHRLRRNGVQCGPQPGASSHLVGARLVEVQVEAVAGCPDGERRSIGPSLDGQPLDGPVGVPLARMTWSTRVPRCPSPRLLTYALGRHTGRSGHSGPLAALPHLFELAENGLGTLHLEVDLPSPSRLHCRADQLRHFAPVIGANDVVPLVLVAQRPLALVLDRADLEPGLWLQASHMRRVEFRLTH